MIVLISIVGMVASALYSYSKGYEKAQVDSNFNCGVYEEDFDQATLLVQTHCIVDDLNDRKQTAFCDALMGKNETDSNFIDLYHFKN